LNALPDVFIRAKLLPICRHVEGSSQVSQPIHVLHLTRIAHITTVPTLRNLMTQVWHSDVRSVLFEQPVNPILPGASALGAFELGRSLAK
jgi:hypothetical protein